MFISFSSTLYLRTTLHSRKFSTLARPMASKCIFCKVIAGEAPGELIYQDDELFVIKDIKPAAKFHYLVLPKEHIVNINHLTTHQKPLIEQLIETGKRVLEEKGGDPGDIRLGFHLPPFNSISHLHLHVISPVQDMSFLGRAIFKPNTWWFASAEQVLEKLESSKL